MSPRRLAVKILEFHGGQNSPLYSVGSRLLSKSMKQHGGPAITCKDWSNAAGELEKHLRNLQHRRAAEKSAGRRPPKWMTEDARGGRAVLHSIRKYQKTCGRR